ncbi:MAG: alkaline phosphatase family protein [Microscillaceae bacterium]
MRRNFFFILFGFLGLALPQALFSQSKSPRLVVGIVVDQMRYDYLYRYATQYSAEGFQRLMKEGFLCRNAHYNFAPTETGPGHASVYTGTTPAVNGIVGNDWFEKGKENYCAGDTTEKAVGSETGYGEISPRNLFSTTLGDELKLATAQRAKVIGISLKDRGAVLPAGHTANGAYWFDQNSGHFITSTYYMDKLPDWVAQYNARRRPDYFLTQTWQTLRPIKEYTASQADDNPYEQALPGQPKAVFPYDFKALTEALAKSQMKRPPYGLLTGTPYGNTLVNEMALEALKAEALGQDDITDLLAISYSSTDIGGHAFGPQSVEVQDIYLRLDQEIALLLKTLDAQVGKGNYTLFLTADHAVTQVPRYAQDLRLPGGYADSKKMQDELSAHLEKTYGAGKWVLTGDDKGVYLNRALLKEKKLSQEMVEREVVDFVRQYTWVYDAYTATDLQRQQYQQGIMALVQAGYYHGRSPDVLIVAKTGYLSKSWERGGTSHGSPHRYDTHVPILFFGQGIPAGHTVREVYVSDIAPTMTMLLNLQMPSGATGKPIGEIFEK